MLAWLRVADQERVLILLNLGGSPRTCDLRRLGSDEGEVVVATGTRSGRVALKDLTLEPLEGIALRIT